MPPGKRHMNRGPASRDNQPKVALPAALEAALQQKQGRSNQLEAAYLQLVMNLNSMIVLERIKMSGSDLTKIDTDHIAKIAKQSVDSCYKVLDIEVSDKEDESEPLLKVD